MKIPNIIQWYTDINESNEIYNIGYRKINRVEFQLIKAISELLYIYGDTRFLHEMKPEHRQRAEVMVDKIIEKPIYKQYPSLYKVLMPHYSFKKRAERDEKSVYDPDNFFYQTTPLYSFDVQTDETRTPFDTKRGLKDGLYKGVLQKIASSDLYTFMSAPDKDSSIEEIVAYILSLTPNPVTTKRLTVDEARNYIHYMFRNKSWFQTLKTNLAGWVEHNDHKSIDKIVKIINDNPILSSISRALNTKELQSIVYRGTVLQGPQDAQKRTIKEIENFDKSRGAIATTYRFQKAKEFATATTDFSKPIRKSGVITVWEITPNDILLDVRLLGSKYDEAEIIINPKSSKIVKSQLFERPEDEIQKLTQTS